MKIIAYLCLVTFGIGGFAPSHRIHTPDDDGVAIERSYQPINERDPEQFNVGDPKPIQGNNHWEMLSIIERLEAGFSEPVLRVFDGNLHLYYDSELVMIFRPNVTAMCKGMYYQ